MKKVKVKQSVGDGEDGEDAARCWPSPSQWQIGLQRWPTQGILLLPWLLPPIWVVIAIGIYNIFFAFHFFVVLLLWVGVGWVCLEDGGILQVGKAEGDRGTLILLGCSGCGGEGFC